MLYWHSPSRHTNSQWMLNNGMQHVSSHYWQPICHIYEQSYTSKSFKAAQFQIHKYIYYLSNEWSKTITFQQFWNAIHDLLINLPIFDIFSLTPSPILIWLSLLDIHDPRYSMLRITPLCTRSEWTVLQLDKSIITSQWSLFIQVHIAQGTLIVWLIWHHFLIFC